MIFVHEVHDVAGGKMAEYGEAVRTRWPRVVGEPGQARLLWYWELAHGTGTSYQAVSLTAVRDWAAWGDLTARAADWRREVAPLLREVTAKILLPAPWSPLADADLASEPAAREVDQPALYLHDTGWPFAGQLDAYVTALGDVYLPQIRRTRMISVVGCWTVAPGTGRHHEVVLLQDRGLGALLGAARPGRAGGATRRVDGRGPPLPRPVGIEAAALCALVAAPVAAQRPNAGITSRTNSSSPSQSNGARSARITHSAPASA